MHQQDYTAPPDVITEEQAAGREAEAELTVLESQGGRVLAILLGPSLWRRRLLLCLRDVCLLLLLWRIPRCQVCDAFKVACMIDAAFESRHGSAVDIHSQSVARMATRHRAANIIATHAFARLTHFLIYSGSPRNLLMSNSTLAMSLSLERAYSLTRHNTQHQKNARHHAHCTASKHTSSRSRRLLD